MKNVIDYINTYGDRTFSELPWNEVDAVALALFSYFRWDGIVPDITEEREAIGLQDMINNIVDPAHVYEEIKYMAEDHGKLLVAMAKSVRFKNMSCNYYSERTCEAEETQFAAFTCFPEGELPVVVYRGTDGTLVGWKEDFNMAFNKPIPGQYLASFYFNHVATLTSKDIRIAGHSKGGNLAIFAAMSAPTGMRERVRDIYAFDSPGFRPELKQLYRYDSISARIRKFMPKSSLIGILLESGDDYTSVNSNAIGGAFQHNPYTWEVDGLQLKALDKIRHSSQYVSRSMNQWIMQLDEEQYHCFVNTLFDVAGASGAKTVADIIDDKVNWFTCAAKMTQKLEKNQRKNILIILKELITAFQPEFRR